MCDNPFHRIHHSTIPAHFDKNFGFVTPLWDVVLGTAHLPSLEDWPDVGLDDLEEVRALGEYMWRPFLPASKTTSRPSNLGPMPFLTERRKPTRQSTSRQSLMGRTFERSDGERPN